MFKVLVIVASIATHQPIGFAVSDAAWPEAECKQHIGEAMRATAQHLSGQPVSFQGVCVDAAKIDALVKQSDKDNSI